ncbi:putative partitioning protein ParB (plasmid) [Zymomonas mobilis subsp. mobilis ZM4 = ATCC 31821]|uniref:Chromosome partitioning protein ParB n=1 Tax=Zymomonas mobilis subsp. mobilis (strain ATCC 31821 / ZM4 / CP4) TaxID=264203 RepID=Q8GF26_ZYMMO|nr:hypothetical protein [Zymomonas mobilis]AAL36143.1 unknown [Zymomonas mobilis subsp. mobilis ZM4 = ATCC 31821]AVZ26914.1 putative partitioning protein ParB [Zymomonas mobilis subsp. mobilis]AVZ28753.1 putative partitioning protein ParB [Zymomonas mobilis subsp. mobilis]AVZ43246.1 putative partitioning protein ParB [Zymomonas mobilis subsp. mobilis ZM4 = ATCC 31821]UBQ08651.1 chromosome partitioning protein ParB [Zymomonas mobilis]
MSNNAFSIDLSRLKKQPKTSSTKETDQVAEELGFSSREIVKKRGRKPSPRTGQVHAKVMPDTSIEIANEAKRRGVQQGVLIEEAWQLYKENMAIK